MAPIFENATIKGGLRKRRNKTPTPIKEEQEEKRSKRSAKKDERTNWRQIRARKIR
jgi:hypothetical protein